MAKLITHGFKGRSAELEVSGAKIAVGENGSGKSAVLDALRFFALGYVPFLGKRPQDTAALMPDDERELSVELVTEGGAARRILTRRENGFSVDASASWLVNAKPSEQAKAITGLFGKEEVDVAEVLDLRELLNATPNQRAARLEALVAAGKRTAEEMLLAVKKKIVQRLAAIDDKRMAELEDYRAALPLVSKKCLAVLDESADLLAAKISDAGIPGALAWANEEKKGAADGVRRREQAAKELRLRAAEVEEPDRKEEQVTEDEISLLDREIGALQNQAKGAEARAMRRRAVLDAAAAADVAAKAAAKGLQELDATARPRIKAIEKEQKAQGPEPVMPGEPPTPPKIAELQAKADKLTREADAIRTEEVPTADVIRAANSIQALKAELEESTTSPWGRVLAIAAKLRKATPAGKPGAALIQELQEIAKAEAADLREPEEIQTAIEAAEKALTASKAVCKAAEGRNAEKGPRREELRAKAREALQEAQGLADEAEGQRRAALGAWSDAHAKWTRQRDALRTERDGLLSRLKTAQEVAESSEARRAGAATLADQQGPEEAPPANPALLVEKRGKLAIRLQELQRAAALFAEINRAIEEIEGARASLDTFAAIEWALQQERQAELAHAGGRFLELVGQFLKAGDRPEKPYIKAGAAIGWTRDGHDIPVQTMSGGEWALFVAAMTTAALLLREARLRILLVEADAMDAATLRAFMLGVKYFLPRLTAAIATTWKRPAEIVPGFEVVEMGAPVSAPSNG